MLSAIMEMQLAETEVKEGFHVTDLNSCIWAFRKIRAYEAKKKEIKEAAAKEKAYIDEWEKGETKSIDSSIGFFEGLLKEYYVLEKAKDPKFKLSTPYGTVSQRKAQDKLDYDEEAFLSWAAENNLDLIRVKQEINKELANEYFKVTEQGQVIAPDTGEILNCVKLVPGETKLTVKIKEEK